MDRDIPKLSRALFDVIRVLEVVMAAGLPFTLAFLGIGRSPGNDKGRFLETTDLLAAFEVEALTC